MDIPHRDTPLNGLIDAIEQQLEQIQKEHDFHVAQEKIHAQLREERESQALHLQETISLFKARKQSSVHYADVPAGPTDPSNSLITAADTEVLQHRENKEEVEVEEVNVTRNSFNPDELESKNSELDNMLNEILLSYPEIKSSLDRDRNYGDWSSST
jgi:hypothetical protein